MAVIDVYRATQIRDEYNNLIDGSFAKVGTLVGLVAYGQGEETFAVGRAEYVDSATIYLSGTQTIDVLPNDRVELDTGMYEAVAVASLWEDEYGAAGTTVRVTRLEQLR